MKKRRGWYLIFTICLLFSCLPLEVIVTCLSVSCQYLVSTCHFHYHNTHFVDLSGRGVEERWSVDFCFRSAESNFLYRILRLWFWFCPLTFRRRLLLFFIMRNDCTFNFRRASNDVNGYECLTHVFLSIEWYVENCVLMLGMFEWMVVFHLRNTWRFSTYQNFWFFFRSVLF